MWVLEYLHATSVYMSLDMFGPVLRPERRLKCMNKNRESKLMICEFKDWNDIIENRFEDHWWTLLKKKLQIL